MTLAFECSDLLVTQPRTTLTAISAWFFSCIFFVFGTLLAYAGWEKTLKIRVDFEIFLKIIYLHSNIRPAFEKSPVQPKKVLRCQKCELSTISGHVKIGARYRHTGLEVSIHIPILVFCIQYHLLDNSVLQKIFIKEKNKMSDESNQTKIKNRYSLQQFYSRLRILYEGEKAIVPQADIHIKFIFVFVCFSFFTADA